MNAGEEEEGAITIVSGLPRSGTSMMMAMLAAGGIEPLVDGHRPADESNRRGYFEFEPVLASRESVKWVPLAQGKVVKVIYALLENLPPSFRYRVIFMLRDVAEVVASQARLLEKLGHPGANASPDQLISIFSRESERTREWLRSQSNFQFLEVDYRTVLANPKEESQRIAEFLGGGLDIEAMAQSVEPELRTVG